MTRRVLLALSCAFAVAEAQADQTVAPNALEMAGHRALARAVNENTNGLNAFTTDGCSGGLSDSWGVVSETFPDFGAALGELPPWEACCVTHDRAYHAGGLQPTPLESFRARHRADEALRSCVSRSGADNAAALAARLETTQAEVEGAFKTIGEAMFIAVRFGGVPCSGLPWRWGYGSPECEIVPGDFLPVANDADDSDP